MTREGAVKILRKEIECLSHEKCKDCVLEAVCDPIKTPCNSEYIEIYEIAIQALEQEPCENAIKKEDVLDAISRIGLHKSGTREVQAVAECLRAVEALTPVNPQPKTGHWIRWYEQKDFGLYIENIPHCKCSECGKEYDPHSSQFIKYCNECGARMVEPQESEENDEYRLCEL